MTFAICNLLFAVMLPLAAAANIYVTERTSDIYMANSSMLAAWDDELNDLRTERNVQTSAIGGSSSWEQVRNFDGVYIAYPQGSEYTVSNWTPNDDQISPGTVTIRIQRAVARRTFGTSGDRTYEAQWPEYAQKVNNPTKVRVTNNGRVIGSAIHNTIEVTTDYATDINRIYATAHGLGDEDIVHFWIDDPDRPQRDAENTVWQSPHRPSAMVEYKAYEVVNAEADSFELLEIAADQQAGTIFDLGSDATGTLICETGWTLDWEYTGGDWELELWAEHENSDRLFIIQGTSNDVDVGAEGNDYYRWDTHTVPAYEYMIARVATYPKRVIFITPAFTTREGGFPDGENYEWINDDVRPWAAAKAAAESGFEYWDMYQVMTDDDQHLPEELALLADPEVAETLHIRGDVTDESTWEAFATDQGDTVEAMVGPGWLPMQYRSSFADGTHLSEAGADYVAGEISDLIDALGW